MNKVRAIARKELIHILRDGRSLAVAVLMPLIMVLLYGAVIDMEMHGLRVGVQDLDQSDLSRQFVRTMTSSGFVVEAQRLQDRSQVEASFRREQFLAAVVIPQGYAKDLRNGVGTVQVLADGSDAATAATAANYLQAVVGLVNRDLQKEYGVVPPFGARTRVWFNPELVSAHFVVPGLVALVLMMICALLTSIAITREKETGTLEQILTTPVTSAQVILGKVLPYVLLGSLDAGLILLVGRVVFGVPMAGSWWLLAAYCLLFVVIALAAGLLISARSPNLRVAMMAALMVTMLPTMILSGFMFPIASMPKVLQVICQILPATNFLVVLRGIMLKGQAWFPVQTLALGATAVVLMVMAVRSFRLRLE